MKLSDNELPDSGEGRMRVVVAVNGRFHAFDLAEQLHAHGGLSRLITPYPKFKVREWGIPDNLVTSFLPLEFLKRGARKVVPDSVLYSAVAMIFDVLSSRCLPEDADIFVGWSGNCLSTLKKAKSMGMITVVERGSSHILYQDRILEEEASLIGIQVRRPSKIKIQRELQEYNLSDYISIPSEYVKKTFLDNGIGEEKLIVTPYGTDLRSFYNVPKEDDVFRVIHCGGINFRKGVHYLVDAFSDLELPNSELWLIGKMEKDMEEYLNRKERKGVRYQGFFPQRELYKHYSQGSLFCLASIEEGLSMVLLQAMACGLPVACSENTGGRDIVGEDSGFVFPIRDVEELKRILSWAHGHPKELAEMGRNAAKRVRSGYTWEDYGRRMVDFYRRACEGKASHGGGGHGVE